MVQGLNAGQAQIFATWGAARGSARVTVIEGTGKRPVGSPCVVPTTRDHGLTFLC
jgi:hypothetical protein